MDSGIHPTLHSKYHHEIFHSEVNLKIEHPPPYARKVWIHDKAQFDVIDISIEHFDWHNFLFWSQYSQSRPPL